MQILNRNNRTEYHLITCDHPFFVDAGLSSFTLPQIMEWWSKRNYDGVYVNQTIFKREYESLRTYAPIDYILKWADSSSDDTMSYVIDSWRYEGYNKGVYIGYMINDNIPPEYGDVRAWEYYNNNPEARQAETGSFSLEFVDIDEFNNKVFDRGSRTLVDPPIPLEDLNFSQLIAMNDKYNILGYEDTALDRARRLLLNDVRKSKGGGYVPWTVETRMFLNVQEGAERCESIETFKFKLFLYNKKKPLDTSKQVAFPSLNIAAPAIGADGVNNLGKQDGDSSPVVDDLPSNKVAGNIRTSFRPYDGAFSAGSEVRLAIVATDIPAADIPGSTATWAEDMDIKEHLDNPDSSFLTPGIGEVISIDMQNANPFQWTPNYAEPKGCRGDNKDKVKLKVFNFNPTNFKRGDFVEIVDQYSLWCVKKLAESEEVLTPKEVSNWRFTYHITNQRYHFRYSDYNTEGDGDSGFHENKRVTSEFQMEKDVALKNLRAKNKLLWGLGKKSAEANGTLDDGTAWPGYAQITSFDYLGKEFAGLRGNKGNALVLTDNRKNHLGEDFASFDDIANTTGAYNIGTWTTPFFGCVFSEGYSDDDKYNNVNGPVFDPETELLTGQGWRPGAIITKTDSAGSQSDINQNELFFDRDMFIGENPTYGTNGTGFTPASNPADTNALDETHGLFQPKAVHNNKSTNYSPAYFLDSTTRDSIDEAKGHVNLFSSEAQLLHLPADIGTNGSWSAQNGGPILNLNKVQQYITNPETINYEKDHKDVANSFHDFWLDPASNQWLYDTIDRTSRNTYGGTDRSALDFKPKNNKKVLFRPLKDTVYCQWDQKQDGTEPFPVKELSQLGFSNYEFTVPKDTIGLTSIGGGAPLFGLKTKNRIVENDKIGDNHHIIVKDWNNDGQYNDVDLGRPTPFEYIMYLNNELDKLDDLEYRVESYSLGMNASLYYGSNLPNANGADDFNGSIEASMGGFGVIGASCTAIVTTGIQFNTSNYLGQAFFFNTATQGFDASWGAKSQLSFNQTGTTQLFVKVYEAWPRDQTIFDSRFFAVHHFNPGNMYPIASDNKRPWEIGYRTGNQTTISLGDGDEQMNVTYDNVTQEATGITLRNTFDGTSYSNNFYFAVDKIATNVDARIPSYFNQIDFDNYTTLNLDPLQAVEDDDIGIRIFNEGLVKGGGNHILASNSEVVHQPTYIKETFPEDDVDYYDDLYSNFQTLAPKNMWSVDPDRRARLLPWYQNQKTIGFGDIEFLSVPSGVDGVLTLDDRPFTEDETETWNKKTLLDITKGANVIVQNPGTGYQLLDKFEVQGGDGSSAEAIVTGTGLDGSVTGLFWNEADTTLIGDFVVREKYNGKDYSQDDFPAGILSGITTDTRSGLSFVPTTGNNRSFRAYLMCGEIVETTNIDHKPKIASENEEAYVLGSDNNTLKSAGSEASRSSHDFQIIPVGATPVAWGGPATTNYNKPQLATDPLSEDKETLMALYLNQEGSNPNTIDGKVDLFFQFHNDITHTKQRYASSAAYENFIDLSVTPY